MTSAELLAAMHDAARECGIEIRRLPPGGDAEPPARSGICRVGERWFAMLAAGDSVEDRIDVLAAALRALGPALDAHWLPPAVRERVDRGGRA